MTTIIKLKNSAINFNELQNMSTHPVFLNIVKSAEKHNFKEIGKIIEENNFQDEQLFLDSITYLYEMGNKFKEGMIIKSSLSNKAGSDGYFSLVIKLLSSDFLSDSPDVNIKDFITKVTINSISNATEIGWDRFCLLLSSSTFIFNNSALFIKLLFREQNSTFGSTTTQSFKDNYDKYDILNYALSRM